LTVRALEYYSKEIGPHSEKANQIFHELRGNIVNNVFEQYKKTGFIWENYNQDTGKFLKFATDTKVRIELSLAPLILIEMPLELSLNR